MKQDVLKQLYQDLLKNLGDQGNWPAESPEEIILGAILVQNTRWENVLLSINNLRQVLDGDFKKILDLEPETLQDLIRPICSMYLTNWSLSLTNMLRNYFQVSQGKSFLTIPAYIKRLS